jgi:integrase
MLHHVSRAVKNLLTNPRFRPLLVVDNLGRRVIGRKRKRGDNGKPWFRRENQSWYLKVGGKQVRLVDKKGDDIRGQEREADALTVWHEMMAKEDARANQDDNSVRLILGLYLERHLKVNAAEKTFREWRDIYKGFCDRWPGLLVRELTPNKLRQWWAEHPTWGSSYQNHIGTALKAALNWAADADSGRLIPRNPLDGMRLPRVRSRGANALISAEDHQKLLAIVPEDLRDVLVALRDTGTRPSNIWRATKKNVDTEQGALVFAEWNTEPGTPIHKTFRKTGESLVVPLTPEVVEICKRLAAKYPVSLKCENRDLAVEQQFIANIQRTGSSGG